MGKHKKCLQVYSSNIYSGLIMNPNAYPNVNPTVNKVCVRNATEPDNYFGVTPKIYLGIIPEFNPMIIPTSILPKNRGQNERSIH